MREEEWKWEGAEVDLDEKGGREDMWDEGGETIIRKYFIEKSILI